MLDYPQPIVDHKEARLRTLAAYEEARKEPDKTQRAFYQVWCWPIKIPAPARGF